MSVGIGHKGDLLEQVWLITPTKNGGMQLFIYALISTAVKNEIQLRSSKYIP